MITLRRGCAYCFSDALALFSSVFPFLLLFHFHSLIEALTGVTLGLLQCTAFIFHIKDSYFHFLSFLSVFFLDVYDTSVLIVVVIGSVGVVAFLVRGLFV